MPLSLINTPAAAYPYYHAGTADNRFRPFKPPSFPATGSSGGQYVWGNDVLVDSINGDTNVNFDQGELDTVFPDIPPRSQALGEVPMLPGDLAAALTSSSGQMTTSKPSTVDRTLWYRATNSDGNFMGESTNMGVGGGNLFLNNPSFPTIGTGPSNLSSTGRLVLPDTACIDSTTGLVDDRCSSKTYTFNTNDVASSNILNLNLPYNPYFPSDASGSTGTSSTQPASAFAVCGGSGRSYGYQSIERLGQNNITGSGCTQTTGSAGEAIRNFMGTAPTGGSAGSRTGGTGLQSAKLIPANTGADAFVGLNPDDSATTDNVATTSRLGTITFTVDPTTDKLTTSSGSTFADGQRITLFANGGTKLPNPLVSAPLTPYYVRDIDATGKVFRLAIAVGGPAINITDTGIGSNTPTPGVNTFGININLALRATNTYDNNRVHVYNLNKLGNAVGNSRTLSGTVTFRANCFDPLTGFNSTCSATSSRRGSSPVFIMMGDATEDYVMSGLRVKLDGVDPNNIFWVFPKVDAKLSVAASASTVNIGTGKIVVANTFTEGKPVVLTGASLPSPLSAGTTYYVKNRTATDFQLSDTLNGTTTISLLTVGSGSFTVGAESNLSFVGPFVDKEASFAPANVSISTDEISYTPGTQLLSSFIDGEQVILTGSALPVGLTSGTTYYVVGSSPTVNPTKFKLSSTPNIANVINITAAATGDFTISTVPSLGKSANPNIITGNFIGTMPSATGTADNTTKLAVKDANSSFRGVRFLGFFGTTSTVSSSTLFTAMTEVDQPALLPVPQLHVPNDTGLGSFNQPGVGSGVSGTNGSPTSSTGQWTIRPTKTEVNVYFVAGNTPARNGVSYQLSSTVRSEGGVAAGTVVTVGGETGGGLPNFIRLLENWQSVPLKIAGGFIQNTKSKFATAPWASTGPSFLSSTSGNGSVSDVTSIFLNPLAPGASGTTGFDLRYQSVTLGNQRVAYFSPPIRLWGYDVGLLTQQPDRFAERFAVPIPGANEFFREISGDDPWVEALLCALEPTTPTALSAATSTINPGFAQSLGTDPKNYLRRALRGTDRRSACDTTRYGAATPGDTIPVGVYQ